MIDLPFNLDTIGDDTPLARYLRDDPNRVPVLETICRLLDDDGRVGDRARYYIARSHFRRAVLRGTLIVLGISLPSWSYSNRVAADANRAFIDAYSAARRSRSGQLGTA